MTGMREQKVMYTYWSDVNFTASTVRVSHKPDRGWTPEAYKEREIPIPARLAKSLRAWKAKADKTCNLVFPTGGCNPKLEFLDCQSRRRACEARGRYLLAGQVSCDLCDAVPLGRRRSAHRAAVARSLRHGIDNAVPKTVKQSADPREGKRDFCVKTGLLSSHATKSTTYSDDDMSYPPYGASFQYNRKSIFGAIDTGVEIGHTYPSTCPSPFRSRLDDSGLWPLPRSCDGSPTHTFLLTS